MAENRITATAEIREYLSAADPIIGAVIEKYVGCYRMKVKHVLGKPDM